MRRHRFSNVRSLTARLLLVFGALAIAVGLAMITLFNTALHWGEDAVNERSLQISKEVAVARYLTGASGPLEIDRITYAFDNLADVPEFVPKRLLARHYAIEELHLELGSVYVLVTEFQKGGARVPLVLVAETESVEVTERETLLLNLMIVTATIGIMMVVGVIVYLLSIRLIQPVKELGDQLASLKDDPQTPLYMADTAAEEFVKLTDAFNQHREDLDKLIRREQAFARYASHELRTPLTIVRGAANLLEHSTKAEFVARQRTRILSATKEMQTMVDALLSLVRYEKSEHLIEPRDLGDEELREIVDQEQIAADNKAVGLTLSVTGTPQIQAEPAVVRMIVGNLLRNAIAATGKGEIGVEMDDHSLSILDQGPGLEGVQCGGHGLGLLIIEDLCQRYRWRFALANREQGGCVARIEFTHTSH
ncbi:HAMP domain-containing histidine kinase [Ferrimonas sediminicola]|uniref:histidine kinase n=1 Tax=Ferrimonas sediminicola TaxID=2569538 RepID=A0A4U1BCX1_9GAMM|nr:HAMP domain-containing sensor histidine kinase [Ferrimonas sediminicola]TKB48386.1 HAMP domain-containing histidine kinase [Ferrimonas sediminicola]